MPHARKNNIPTIFVAFGVTGDLMKLKVIPALFRLHQEHALPTMFRVIGIARRDWGDTEFREYIRDVVMGAIKNATDEECAAFLEFFQYEKGEFSDHESYVVLKKTIDQLDTAWGVCSNKIFYLAVAPEFYEPIAHDLSLSGLTEACGPEEGWTRVIVEKPFGQDSASAVRLEALLAKFFREEQIYRIDHYLAKEMLENILDFRFANNLFERQWDASGIESIHIRLFERVGAEKRGAFYDTVGALRDVGQNHLLQILALLMMERPTEFSAVAIRDKRADVLEQLEIIAPEAVPAATFRAQYEGFCDIEGVAPGSLAETYFKIRASLRSTRWQGVPITMEAGKRMGDPLKEIVVRFKHPEPCLCPPGTPCRQNEITIRMEPREEIRVSFTAKKPGLTSATEERALTFMLRHHEDVPQYTEEYERLLADAIKGDQTLFVSAREVAASWRYIDPIVSVWRAGTEKSVLHTYVPDTRDIADRATIT